MLATADLNWKMNRSWDCVEGRAGEGNSVLFGELCCVTASAGGFLGEVSLVV